MPSIYSVIDGQSENGKKPGAVDVEAKARAEQAAEALLTELNIDSSANTGKRGIKKGKKKGKKSITTSLLFTSTRMMKRSWKNWLRSAFPFWKSSLAKSMNSMCITQ